MLFSIVIPVYNVEPYLRACIDSVLSQSFRDFELILVDDGSPDQCPQICDEYAGQDDRVTVIHKENGGLSDARNVGIRAARGRYLIFLDSDDALRQNCLAELAPVTESAPDVILTEIQNTTDVEHDVQHAGNLFEASVRDRADAIRFVFSEKEHTWAAVQYILSLAYLKQADIWFEKGVYHEDIAWTAQIISRAESFAVYTGNWYIRRLGRENSITSSVRSKRTTDVIQSVASQIENPLYDVLSDTERDRVFTRMVKSVYYILSFVSRYSNEEIKTISRVFNEHKRPIIRYTRARRHKVFLLLTKLVGTYRALKILSKTQT